MAYLKLVRLIQIKVSLRMWLGGMDITCDNNQAEMVTTNGHTVFPAIYVDEKNAQSMSMSQKCDYLL